MILQNNKGKEKNFKITRKRKRQKTIKLTGDFSIKAKRQWNDIFKCWEKNKLYTQQNFYQEWGWNFQMKIDTGVIKRPSQCQLSIYCFSAPNSSFCSTKVEMSSLNTFLLPAGILLSFGNRGHWRAIAGEFFFLVPVLNLS